jgi:spermidine synthase
MVVEASVEYLPFTACSLGDPRVRIYYEDGVKFVRRKKADYDLIIVDSTDPFGPGEGLFTRVFYGSCYMALRDDGIMVNQHESPFYPNDAAAMQRAHRRIVESFRSAGSIRRTYRPIPPATGSSASPLKNIIRWRT